jgi:hypothetical protein
VSLFDHWRNRGRAHVLTTGRVPGEELAALEQHLHECDECRVAYAHYLDSVARLASQQASGSPQLLRWPSVDALRRRRFLEAATTLGLTFSHEAFAADAPEPAIGPPGRQPWVLSAGHWRWAAVVAVLIGLGGASAFVAYLARPDVTGTLAILERENALLRDQLRGLTASRRSEAVPSVAPDPALTAELDRARRNVAAAGRRVGALERSLREALTALAALHAEAARAATDNAALRALAEQTEERVAALRAERDRILEQRAADATFIELQSARIARLSEQGRDRDETLVRQQELLAADRDIRDLMGARNLHVIDVFDVDGRGKTRQAFGRAFYTEGKSLIFYAFDLAPRQAARTSFQAWGHRTADEQSTQSLGILYSDDKAQNRWILKFDDPKILDQIDAVFVTVEPPGGSARPSGQKLLYAYLHNKPNHP